MESIWRRRSSELSSHMVQDRGSVQIALREIPNYGVVVIDPFSFLRVNVGIDVGIDPLLLSIDGVSIANTPLPELSAGLRGEVGTQITLELLSSDLSRCEKVVLTRESYDTIRPLTQNSLKDSLIYLDGIDETDWSGHALGLAETAAASTLDPLGSALFNSAIRLSRGWFDGRTFLHFFTQAAAARYFDSIYKIDEANLAIESALEKLPNFDCLDFDESNKLFEFVGYLIETQRLSQALLLLDKLTEAAQNSIDYENKVLACLKLKQRIGPLESLDFLDNLFDKKKFSLSSEDLHFVADNFLFNGDYKRAIMAFGLLSTQSRSSTHDFELRDFIQPSTYAQFKQAFAFKSDGDLVSANIALGSALTTLHSNFSDEQLAMLDSLPGYFPKPKDIESQLKGTIVPFTARFTDRPSFPMILRTALDALQTAGVEGLAAEIEKLIRLADGEDNVTFSENLVFTSLLNLARQFVEQLRFDLAKVIFNRLNQQAQGPDFAPQFLVASFTEQAIFAGQLGLESDGYWLALTTLLKNFFAGTQALDVQEEKLRQKLVKARLLRWWALAYLRNHDYYRALQILYRAADIFPSYKQTLPARHLTDLINTINADIAVCQIALSQSEEAADTIEKIFAEPPIFYQKMYQIAEAYRDFGQREKAQTFLSRSLSRSKSAQGAIHTFKLAQIKHEHRQFVEEASTLLSPNKTPPQLVLMLAEYAEFEGRFEDAQNHYQQAAALLPKQSSQGIEVAEVKRKLILNALNAADKNQTLAHGQELNLTREAADLSYGLNRMAALVNYRRVLGLSFAPTRHHHVISDRLSKLSAKKELLEQLAEEKKYAQQSNKECQVKTEHFWIDFATDEFRRNKLATTIQCIEHAFEIYQLSSKEHTNFRPLFVCQENSLPELFRKNGFPQDAESYLLRAITATTIKYGVDSEQESLCLIELAHFYFNSEDSSKSNLIVTEILHAYQASAILSATETARSNAVIFRLQQLALEIAAQGNLIKSIRLLELIMAAQQKILPSDHIDLVNSLLMLARFKKQNNEPEVAETIFDNIYQGPLTEAIYPSLTRFAPDYCDVLNKMGKLNAAKKMAYLFSTAADEAVEEWAASNKLASSDYDSPTGTASNDDEKDWEEIGRTTRAKARYIKSVKLVQDQQLGKHLATEALSSLAAHYVENNKLGQAAEVYLELASRLQKLIVKPSFRKVLCFLSLARCYTRLCMYEEVPDFIQQAKENDPEIFHGNRTIDNVLNYIDIEVEAHLLDAARDDLAFAELLVDEQSGSDEEKKRKYLERIRGYWETIGDRESANFVKTKIITLPPQEEPPDKEVKEFNVSEKSVTTETPPPFGFLECISTAPVELSSPGEAPADFYLQSLAEKISENWFPPVERLNTQVQIKFSIASDGSWELIKFVRPSGNKYSNVAVEDAIKAAAPFDCLPGELGNEAIFVLTINDALYLKDRVGVRFESVE